MKLIYYIEDEPDLSSVVKLALEVMAGYTVQCYEDGESGIEAVRSRRPDLVLLDYMLPRMDGLEVLTRLRTLPGMENLPVMFITARSQQHLGRAVTEADVIETISKPFDPAALVASIQRFFKEDKDHG